MAERGVGITERTVPAGRTLSIGTRVTIVVGDDLNLGTNPSI